MAAKPDNCGGRSNNSRICDGGENVKWEREKHRRKQSSPTNSTDEGRAIDVSDVQQENTPSSTRTSPESSGKGEITSFWHKPKQRLQSVLIDAGRVIDSSEEQ
jgi:hypothetical protein